MKEERGRNECTGPRRSLNFVGGGNSHLLECEEGWAGAVPVNYEGHELRADAKTEEVRKCL